MDIDNVLKGHRIGVGGGSNIKSIQRGTVSLPIGSTSVQVTISNVNLSASIVKQIYEMRGSYPSQATVAVSLVIA